MGSQVSRLSFAMLLSRLLSSLLGKLLTSSASKIINIGIHGNRCIPLLLLPIIKRLLSRRNRRIIHLACRHHHFLSSCLRLFRNPAYLLVNIFGSLAEGLVVCGQNLIHFELQVTLIEQILDFLFATTLLAILSRSFRRETVHILKRFRL